MWESRWWCVLSVKAISKVEQKVLKFVLGGKGRRRWEKDTGVDLKQVREESRDPVGVEGKIGTMRRWGEAFQLWDVGWWQLSHGDMGNIWTMKMQENRDIWEQHGQDPNEGTWLVYWRKETKEAEVEGKSLKIGYMVRETITWWQCWWRKRRRRRRKSWRNIRSADSATLCHSILTKAPIYN